MSHETCAKRCQYAEDVGMHEHSCAGKCQYVLAELREKLAALEQYRMQIEMSDDRAYSNGRMAKIDDEIAAVRKMFAELEE